MELPDGLLLQVNNGEQWCNRWKHPNEDSDRSTSPSVLRSVARTWKEGLLNRKRPFVGRCCHSCTPQSWEQLFNSSIPSLGLRNVIYINETHTRQRGWLARRLSYVLFVMERDVHKDMFTRNVVDNVLNSSRVETAILAVATDSKAAASRPGQEHKSVSKVRQKARAFLQEMVANISPAFIRLTGWVLLRLFNGFFWSIQIHKGQLEMVKKAASEQNIPMVFLPVHKSHIDYLLITLILFCHNIKAPHIAAGNNLSIPILSTVIRKLGGFFIRRRMEDSGDGKKDILYRSLLHAYTEELMRQQQFLEIFLEGTRSRSGKPFPARAGMLSIVVDTLCTGAIGDLLVVPVGISYDRIIEGNYNSEQLGKPKKNESWWGIACGVFRMLRKNYGCVRVDFNQPFSLKEYLDTQRSRHIPPPVSLENALLPIIISAQPDGRLFEAQEEEQMDRELPAEIFRRQLINNLAKHVLFTANKSSAIMSTHIVACLLLYRHRQGVVLSRLVEDFFNMKEEILSRDFDLGFSGNSEDVVMRALHLLEKCVNVTGSSNRNGEFTIAPAQTVPALFELNFYSNGLFLVFISDAIIACSILSLQRELLMESGCGHPPKDPNSLLLSQERLIHKAAGLSQFLINEVAVASPCQTICQVFLDAVTRLIQYGVLYVAEEDQEELNSSPSEEPWPKKFSEPLSWRSDEEDEDSDFGEEQRDRYLKVSVSTEHQEFFSFLQRLLSPVLEAYGGAAVFIHSLSEPMSESDYTQRLFKFLLTRTERGVAAYGESATHYLVKNTVKTFKELGVLKERRENSTTMLELSSTFLPQANRNKLLQYILGFTLIARVRREARPLRVGGLEQDVKERRRAEVAVMMKTKRSRHVSVLLPNKQHLDCSVSVRARGQEVMNSVRRQLGVSDLQVFGLSVLRDNEYLFLDLTKKLSKYFGKRWNRGSLRVPFILFLRIQFYVGSGLLILSSKVQQLYFTELRHKVLRSQSCHQEALLFQLAASALQAEVGDQGADNEGREAEQERKHYFLPEDYFPFWMIKRRGRDYLLRHSPALHSELRGLSQSRAVLQFIKESSRLQDGAVTFYRMKQDKKEKRSSVLLGVAGTGVHVYLDVEGKHCAMFDFSWTDIDHLTFQGCRFEIGVVASLGLPKLVYYTCTAFHSEHILRHLRNTHQFHISTRAAAGCVQQLEDLQASRFHKEAYICDVAGLRQSLSCSYLTSSTSDCSAAVEAVTVWTEEEEEGSSTEVELSVDEPEEVFVDNPDEVPWLAEMLHSVSVDEPLTVPSSSWAAVTMEMKQVLWRRAGEGASVH